MVPLERSVWEELSADAVHAISTLMPFYPLTPSGMLNLTLVNKATRGFLKPWLEKCKQKTVDTKFLTLKRWAIPGLQRCTWVTLQSKGKYRTCMEPAAVLF